jgi:thioredoxin reductase (NADPH)
MYDIIIIGAGVSGFAGAMYAGRLNMKTLVLGEIPGGVIITTDTVENYPGFKKLTGQELADNIRNHAMEYDVDFVQEKVSKVTKKKDCISVEAAGKKYQGKTILFATGTKHRKLNIPGEKEFENKGVHVCALCDGFFFKDKVVAVIGGSDSAAKEALVLNQMAKKVYIIYRGDKIRPEPVNMERVNKAKKIEIINNTNVLEVKGDKMVTSIVLDKAFKGKKELKLSGIFTSIGLIPLSDLAKDLGVKLNKKKEIIINRNAETNIPGVYAAGDIGDTKFKQAITGVAEAVLGAYSAYEYVNTHEFVCPTDSHSVSNKRPKIKKKNSKVKKDLKNKNVSP